MCVYKTHHSNDAKTVAACSARHGLEWHACGDGSKAPKAMKPANQKIIVTASIARTAYTCDKLEKKMGTRDR
jgi:hypothetical protein